MGPKRSEHKETIPVESETGTQQFLHIYSCTVDFPKLYKYSKAINSKPTNQKINAVIHKKVSKQYKLNLPLIRYDYCFE